MLPEISFWNPADISAGLKLVSRHADSTAEFGKLLATLLRPDDVISMDGDLGAGKTALTTGIAAGLKCRVPVSSPTFTLLIEHPAMDDGLALYHFDVYRLSGSDEFCDAGLDEYLDLGGISIIEWGSRIADMLPPRTLMLQLCQGDPDEPDTRLIHLTWPGCPERLADLAFQLRQ